MTSQEWEADKARLITKGLEKRFATKRAADKLAAHLNQRDLGATVKKHHDEYIVHWWPLKNNPEDLALEVSPYELGYEKGRDSRADEALFDDEGLGEYIQGYNDGHELAGGIAQCNPKNSTNWGIFKKVHGGMGVYWNGKYNLEGEGSYNTMAEAIKAIDLRNKRYQDKKDEEAREKIARGAIKVVKDGDMVNLTYPDGSVGRMELRRFRQTMDDIEAKWKAEIVWSNPKRNPATSADALFEDFHGRPPARVLEIEERVHVHRDLAGLGELMQLKIRNLDAGIKVAELDFNGFRTKGELDYGDPGAVQLCSSENRLQLYVRGGDQEVNLSALGMAKAPWLRDHMVLGELMEFTYRTEKGFDNFDVLDYYHKAGEETKIRPIVLYDSCSQLVSIAGGQYKVKAEGVVN